jgi:hypothetical protein
MKRAEVNVIILAILAAVFFVYAIRTGTAWAQTMAFAAFTSMCIAMQLPTTPGGPPPQP